MFGPVGLLPGIINPNTIREIIVPFEVGDHGVEIVSIADAYFLKMPKGLYELSFRASPAFSTILETYQITFIKSDKPTPRIVKADDGLNPPAILFMESFPAV